MKPTGKVTPTTPITSALGIKRSTAAILTDPGRPGLRLVTKGERRVWIYRYRTASGLRQVGLGEYPRTSWADAARAWTKLKVERDDPTRGDPAKAKRVERQAERQATAKARQRAALTLGRLIDDYLREVVERRRKPKGAREVSRMLNAPAVLKVRNWPAAEFERKHAAELIKAVLAGRNGEQAPRVAYMTRQELRAAWRYAVDNGLIDGAAGNPFDGRHLGGSFTFAERDRRLSDDEAARLLRWMRTPGAYSRTVADALELALRTGLRTGEVCGIRKDELQRRGGVLWLDIPAARMKAGAAHSVPLVGRAADIVQSRLTGAEYLFPGRRGGSIDQKVLGVEVYAHSGRSAKPAYAKKRVCPVREWAPHDLRRTARQMLAVIGCPFEIGETLIAHRLPKVQRTYVDLSEIPGQLVEWMTKLNRHIDGLQPVESETVVHLVA